MRRASKMIRTPKEKKAIVQHYIDRADYVTKRDFAKSYDIGVQTLNRWIRQEARGEFEKSIW